MTSLREIVTKNIPVTVVYSPSKDVTSYLSDLFFTEDSVRLDVAPRDLPQYAYMLPMGGKNWYYEQHITDSLKGLRILEKALKAIPRESHLKVVVFTSIPKVFFTLKELPRVATVWATYLNREDIEFLTDRTFTYDITKLLYKQYSNDVDSIVYLLNNPEGIKTAKDVTDTVGIPRGTLYDLAVKLLSDPSGDGRITIRNRMKQGSQLLHSFPRPEQFYNKFIKVSDELLQMRELKLLSRGSYTEVDKVNPQLKHFRRYFQTVDAAPLEKIVKLRLLAESRDLATIVYRMYT